MSQELVRRQEEQIAKASLRDSEVDADIDFALEDAGLSRRQMVRYLKQLLDADPSKVFTVTNSGEPRLKPKILPKHAVAIMEVSKGRIRFVDRTKVVELLMEVGRFSKRGAQPKTVVNDNRRQAIVQVPDTLSKEEAFRGLLGDNDGDVIDAEIKESE